MSLFEVGRLCLKVAGRDAGRSCVVVEQVDDHFVVIDGDVRRRRVNVKHLEPTTNFIELSGKVTPEQIAKVFEAEGWPVWRHTAKKVGARPVQVRAQKAGSKPADASAKLVKAPEKVSVKPKVSKKAVNKE